MSAATKRLADPAFLTRLDAAVTAAELGTSADILVAIEGSSELYRDVDRGLAAVAATLALCAVVFVEEVEIEHAFVAPILVAVYLAAFFAARHLAPLRRLFTSRARRFRAARQGARLAFFEENVAASPGRDGVLLYVSLFEEVVEIVPDVGLDGKVGADKWNAIERKVRSEGRPLDEALVAAVGELGALLSAAAPAGAGTAADRGQHQARVRS